MSMEINGNHSTAKKTTQGVIAGAAVGTGVGAGVILKPVAQDSFNKSIQGQKSLVKYWVEKQKAKYGTVKEYLSAKADSVLKSAKSDAEKMSLLKKIDQEQKILNLNEGVEDLAKTKTSKSTAVKKAFKGVGEKIKTTIDNFKATPNKLEWVKNHKTQLKKLLIPAAVGAGVAAIAAVTINAIKNHKAQKEAE